MSLLSLYNLLNHWHLIPFTCLPVFVALFNILAMMAPKALDIKCPIKHLPVLLPSSMVPTKTNAFLTADYDMNMFDCHDPISYQATTNKQNDPDLPTYFEALTGPGCEAFYEAMGQEI